MVVVGAHGDERQSRDGGDGRKSLWMLGGHLVAHLSAVRHSGEEDIAAAHAIVFLKTPHETVEIGRVINAVARLKRIAHIPAAVTGAVLSSLRPAYGKAMNVREFHEP